MDCKNLSIEELSKKLKEMEGVAADIKSLFSALSYSNWHINRETREEFLKTSIREQQQGPNSTFE